MKNTQQNQDQAKTELLECRDKLDQLFFRIGFVSSGCAQSTDWIDEGAAGELCQTVNSIQTDLGEVIERLKIASKAILV